MAVEAPWLAWFIRGVTMLPKDQILFQLDEQIMWVDLDRNIAAGVVAGHGLVVVVDKDK